MNDLVEEVRSHTSTPQRRVFEKLWEQYPDEGLWLEVLYALPGATTPSIAFVHAVLRDRKRKADYKAYHNTFTMLVVEGIDMGLGYSGARHRALRLWEDWRKDPSKHPGAVEPARKTGGLRGERNH